MKLLFILTGIAAIMFGLSITPNGNQYKPWAKPQAIQTPVEAPQFPPNCYRQDKPETRLEACQALYNAGFTREATQVMLAVSQGESGLRLEAEGDQTLTNNTWGYSIGAFQIRTLKAQTGTGSCRDIQALKTQGWNFHAKCAYQISAQGTNFKPWTVWLKGTYKQYL